MKLGMIGLGRMGGNMVRRWIAAEHEVVEILGSRMPFSDEKDAFEKVAGSIQH